MRAIPSIPRVSITLIAAPRWKTLPGVCVDEPIALREVVRGVEPVFAGFILTIIGACIASRKIRGGSGLHLALGIVISAVYIMFLQTSTTFSTKSDLSPFLAVWIPNFIFAGVAFFLYRRQIR